MAGNVTSLKTTVSGYLRYRGREGHLSFLLHRLTGLGTLLFLLIHIVDTAMVYYYPSLYEEAVNLYRAPLFMVGEMGLVFSVIFHGINGLRIAYLDILKPENWEIRRQRRATKVVLAVSIVLWLPAAFIMGRNLLAHL